MAKSVTPNKVKMLVGSNFVTFMDQNEKCIFSMFLTFNDFWISMVNKNKTFLILDNKIIILKISYIENYGAPKGPCFLFFNLFIIRFPRNSFVWSLQGNVMLFRMHGTPIARVRKNNAWERNSIARARNHIAMERKKDYVNRI